MSDTQHDSICVYITHRHRRFVVVTVRDRTDSQQRSNTQHGVVRSSRRAVRCPPGTHSPYSCKFASLSLGWAAPEGFSRGLNKLPGLILAGAATGARK